MYEHSYHMDFGAAAGAYVDAFMDNVDFAKVYARYQAAVHDASEPYGATKDDMAGARVLDVRRAAVYEKSPTMIPGAEWRDPSRVGEWSAELRLIARSSCIAFTVTRWPGDSTAPSCGGIAAHFLRGGIDGWR
jgi:Fe-Mn family superoxide dismutase